MTRQSIIGSISVQYNVFVIVYHQNHIEDWCKRCFSLNINGSKPAQNMYQKSRTYVLSLALQEIGITTFTWFTVTPGCYLKQLRLHFVSLSLSQCFDPNANEKWRHPTEAPQILKKSNTNACKGTSWVSFETLKSIF